MAPSPPPHSPQRRRELGAFYTPDHVVGYMVSLLRGLDSASKVLEPSGGDGAFVGGLLGTGKVAPSQIEVWDIDPATAPAIGASGATFTLKDALLSDPHPPSFTHVIGNPPYLNKQSAYIKANREALRRRFAAIGANDTYAMFTFMSLNSLAPGGQLVFLVSDTFLTLGIHRKLRKFLLTENQVNSITLLPSGTFGDAAVRTAVLDVSRSAPPVGHRIRFVDLSARRPGDYWDLPSLLVPQSELAALPGHLFAPEDETRQILRALDSAPKLLALLDGGLGMHTTDNAAYLALVEYPQHGTLAPARSGAKKVPLADVDGSTWRFYHKRGGLLRWYGPAEHCLRWDDAARAHYGIPKSALAGSTPGGRHRRGLIVSGIASRLTARLATPGALWESNKAFCFFPRNPKAYPVEFFVAILNSAWYDRVVRALNHTVSLQVRDLQQLPLLPFTAAEVSHLADLGRQAISRTRRGLPVEPQETVIDALVSAVAERLLGTT